MDLRPNTGEYLADTLVTVTSVFRRHVSDKWNLLSLLLLLLVICDTIWRFPVQVFSFLTSPLTPFCNKLHVSLFSSHLEILIFVVWTKHGFFRMKAVTLCTIQASTDQLPRTFLPLVCDWFLLLSSYVSATTSLVTSVVEVRAQLVSLSQWVSGVIIFSTFLRWFAISITRRSKSASNAPIVNRRKVDFQHEETS